MSFPKNKFLVYFSIWFFAAVLGCYYRLYPLILYRSDQTDDKAKQFVAVYLKEKITQQINQNFPQLPKEQKEVLIKENLRQILEKEQKNIKSSVELVSKNIQTSLLAGKDHPYLLESDPFYYYNLTENIVNTGHISDTIKGSKYLNKLMLAPEGHWEPLNLNPYVGFYIYNLIKIFNPDVSLMQAVSYTPLVVVTLAIIPFLGICYLLGCHPAVSFTGASYFLLSPIFIKRSSYGWYDNDPYNTFFPLMILWTIFGSFRHKDSKQKTILFAFLCAMLIAAYAYFWQGWVFIFSIIIGSGIGVMLFSLFKKDTSSAGWAAKFFGLILGISFLGLSLAFGPKDFFILFKEGWEALTNFLTPRLSAWPDLYMTVGELHKISFPELMTLIGGWFFFGVALLGLLGLFIRSWNETKAFYTFKNIFLGVFFLATLVITLGAQRFALLLLVPTSILFTYGLQSILEFIQKQKWPKPAQWAGGFLLIALIFFPAQHLHRFILNILNPIFNQTWENALVEIRDRTPENSIVNTWWPPGHFIKAVAHRRVTFDGATINFPQAYWMANVFITNNETEALGILRMLNTSANEAADYLTSLSVPLPEAIEILKTIIQLPDYKAQYLLKRKFTREQILHLLDLTHTKPPPSYIFLYNEFVENNIQLKFLGKWNFKTIEMINNDPKMLKKVPKAGSKEYIQFLWELVDGPYQYSPRITQVGQKGTTFIFQQNFHYDIQSHEAYILNNKNQKVYPKSIFYLDGNNVQEKIFEKPGFPFSVIIFEENGQKQAIMLSPELAHSVLIQLYFFDGKGLKYFKPFTEQSDPLQNLKIKVFEINWDAFLTDLRTENQ